MKNTILLILLFIPVLGFSQKREVKNKNEEINITLDSTYIVQRDTSQTGVITILFIPTEELLKELESSLGSLKGKEEEILSQIEVLQTERKKVREEIKEVEKLIQNLNKPRTIKKQ